MKTVLEQLMELNEKLAELEKAVIGSNTDAEVEAAAESLFPEAECDGYCGCGCDDNEVETDEGVEQVILRRGETITPDQANVIVFTKEELIDFAFKLMDRTVDACKEAVDTAFGSIDIEDLTTIELGWDNRITVEVDEKQIINEVQAEIINTVDLDTDSVESEVDDVLRHMIADKES